MWIAHTHTQTPTYENPICEGHHHQHLAPPPPPRSSRPPPSTSSTPPSNRSKILKSFEDVYKLWAFVAKFLDPSFVREHGGSTGFEGEETETGIIFPYQIHNSDQFWKQVFQFADKYRGSYSSGLKKFVCPYYCFYSGYEDELLWGAAWLHKATRSPKYLNYIQANGQTLGAGETNNTFGWDNKHAGARILLSKEHNVEGNFSSHYNSVVSVASRYNIITNANKCIQEIKRTLGNAYGRQLE